MNIQIDRRWECPNCTQTAVTHEPQPHTRFHACRGLGGLTAPLIESGSGARLVVREREDYVGDELVTTLNGRPIMSLVTERPDGSNDVVVFAATATAKGDANGLV